MAKTFTHIKQKPFLVEVFAVYSAEDEQVIKDLSQKLQIDPRWIKSVIEYEIKNIKRILY